MSFNCFCCCLSENSITPATFSVNTSYSALSGAYQPPVPTSLPTADSALDTAGIAGKVFANNHAALNPTVTRSLSITIQQPVSGPVKKTSGVNFLLNSVSKANAEQLVYSYNENNQIAWFLNNRNLFLYSQGSLAEFNSAKNDDNNFNVMPQKTALSMLKEGSERK